MSEYDLDPGTIGRQPQLPAPGQASKETLVEWVKKGLYYEHRLRVFDASEMREYELYDQGEQWLDRAMAGYDSGMGGASSWRKRRYDKNDPNYMPTPVYNEGFGARQNESARIGRPKYEPTARVVGTDPDIALREGARKVQRQLRHRLRDMQWDRREDIAYYVQPIHGGFWIKGEWEQTWDKTTVVPVQGAMQCSSPDCDFTIASAKLSKPMVQGITAQAGDGVIAPGQMGAQPTLKACPQCPDHPPLVPLKPTMEEARTQGDTYGQSLGQTVPLGDWNLSIRWSNDVFPRDLGVDMSPGSVDEVTEAHVQTLDWAAKRWPDKMANVQPENPATLAKYHPVAGSPEILAGVLHSSVFRNSARCIERHRAPQMQLTTRPDGSVAWEMDRGRSVVIFGGEVMLDADLLMPSQTHPGMFVERAIYDYCPWDFQDGARRLQGLPMWRLMRDPQDTRNQIAGQTQLIRERMAVPFYMGYKQQNWNVKAFGGGIPGRLVEIDINDPDKPTPMPQMLNNETIDPRVWEEAKDAVDAIMRFANNRAEQGISHPGDPAELFRQAKEAAGERRENRILRIGACFRKMFEHGYRLMAHLYIEPRECSYEEDDGEERWSQTMGRDLPLNLEIDVKPDQADDDETRLVLKDMLAVPFLLPLENDPKLARKVRRHWKGPDDLDEDIDLQEKAAQREFIAFREDGVVPYVDPGLDDHGAHHDQHGRSETSEWFRDLKERADWNGALRILTDGWQMVLDNAKLIPGPPCYQERLVMLWTQKIQMAGQMAALSGQPVWTGDPQALQQVLSWRAHDEAHKLEEQLKMTQAMVQQGVLPAPGAEQTPAGTQPTMGAAPEAPQPGPVPMPAAPAA